MFAQWVDASASSSRKSDLLIGDFDGDSRSDVLWADGRQWRIKHAATGGWSMVSESSASSNELRVGDFNGDGKADVLWADGRQWRIKYAATGGWVNVSDSTSPASELLIGDFDGDRKADVLWADGRQWRIKYGATGGWDNVSDSTAPASELVVGDFAFRTAWENGDWKRDVLWATGLSGGSSTQPPVAGIRKVTPPCGQASSSSAISTPMGVLQTSSIPPGRSGT